MCIQGGAVVKQGLSNRRQGRSTAATASYLLRPAVSICGLESTVMSLRRQKYVSVASRFRFSELFEIEIEYTEIIFA